MIEVNYLAVLVCGVVAMIIGGLWYGPIFGKPWIREMGIPQTEVDAMKAKGQKGMAKSYFLMFVGSLVMAYVLSHVANMAALSGVSEGVSGGLSTGFFMWLGFVAVVLLGQVLWEKKSWKLWTINSAYYLVLLLVSGAIIGAWS